MELLLAALTILASLLLASQQKRRAELHPRRVTVPVYSARHRRS